MDKAVGRASTLIRHWRDPCAIQMLKQGRGISTVVAVVVVIIIIAAAAGAIYFVAVPGSKTSSSSTTPITASSSSSHSTSSQSSSSAAASTTKQSSSSTLSSVQSSTPSSTQSSQSTSSTRSLSTFTFSSCSYTTAVSNTNKSLVSLYRNFSQMAVEYNLSSSNIIMTSSYTAVSVNATTFKVVVHTNITMGSLKMPEDGTFWVRTDGTVIAAQASVMGFAENSTQSIALYQGMMTPFATELTYGAQAGFYTSSNYFKQTGTGTASFGLTTMSVTNYAANSLPETISECGTSMTLNAYSLQLGAVPSSNLQILTMMHFGGTVEGTEMDMTMSLISLTKA